MSASTSYASLSCFQSVSNACRKLSVDTGRFYYPLLSQAIPKNRSSLPAQVLFELLQEAQTQTGNPAIALNIGKSIFLTEYFGEHIANAITCSSTIRQGLFIIRRYDKLTQNFNQVRIRPDGNITALEWHFAFDDAEYCRLAADMVTSMSVTLARWLSWAPTSHFARIHFRHKDPGYGEAYQQIFGCKVLFEQPVDALFMNARSLDMPLPQANPTVVRRLCRELDIALLGLEDQSSTRIQTAQTIRALIGKEFLSLEKIAQALRTSPRTLRRKLKEENTCYRNLLEIIRKDLCEQYLLEGRNPLRDIAAKLGYSDTTAFNRAFKAWFGLPPKAYVQVMPAYG